MSFRNDIDHLSKDNIMKTWGLDNLGIESLRVTTKEAFDYFYNKEALTFEEVKIREGESINMAADRIKTSLINRGMKNPIVYWFLGSDINAAYHLTGSNAYRNEHIMFIVPWNVEEFSPAPFKEELNMRYFADVVDNNARREIWKSNPFYEEYHSLYGDEWFWTTVEDLRDDSDYNPEI